MELYKRNVSNKEWYPHDMPTPRSTIFLYCSTFLSDSK